VHEVPGVPKAVHAQVLGTAPGAVNDATAVRWVGLSPDDERARHGRNPGCAPHGVFA
jgi:hypothetical protein